MKVTGSGPMASIHKKEKSSSWAIVPAEAAAAVAEEG
jgi:hypothetical protein